MFQIPECLDNKFRKGAEIIKDCNSVRIITHYDADGVSSASLLYSAMKRSGKNFHISFLKDLTEDNLKSLLKGSYDCIILADLGSSFVSLLEEYGKVLILDHHPPERDSEKIVHINPIFCNISGTSGACGSTLSYIFSMYIDEENWKNYPAFFTGVVGDRQHLNGYSGLNKIIVDYLEGKGVKKYSDISLDGSNLKEMFLYATDPFLPGYTGSEESVSELLGKLKIKEDISIKDMDDDTKTYIYSWIAINLIKNNVEKDIVQGIITEKHYLETYETWDITLSSYIDAVARMNMQGLALRYLSGDMDKKNEILEAWMNYKNILIKELYNGMKNKIEKENIQYFYVQENSLAGSTAGILMSYVFARDKPTFAIHDSNGEMHVSGRGTRTLVEKGLNLGKAMRSCAEKVKGAGGGHDIAAGSTIPSQRIDEFIECLNQVVGSQLNRN